MTQGQHDMFGRDAWGAVFSHCRSYRYRLWRHYDDGPSIVWVLLNPSTADETVNDPTVERCCRRSIAMGHPHVEVVNLFAYRSTDPAGLRHVDDPVGPANDAAILDAVAGAGLVVCGWGNHGARMGRGAHVLSLLREAGVRAHALCMTGAGQPGHPLYVGYDVAPTPLDEFENVRKEIADA